MNNIHRARQIALACTAAWALVACGGGGGGGGSSNAGASNGMQSTGFSGQDASAPAPTNNIATDGLNWINYRRGQIGMPALTHSSVIDVAAQGHSNYQRTNNIVTHTQTAGKPGYTGADLQDRLQAAGYVFAGENAIGEVISATTGGSGFYMAEELITAIYHRFVIFEPVFKEIGTGAATTSANYSYFTADFVANEGYGPGIPAGTVVTWPFNGQTQVPGTFLSDYEEPDPVPNINAVGYPVSVHTNLSRKLTVQSFTIRAHGASADLQSMLLDKDTDVNKTTSQSVAAIIPLAPLASGTTYDVTFNGAVDGTPVSRSWSFTTK